MFYHLGLSFVAPHLAKNHLHTAVDKMPITSGTIGQAMDLQYRKAYQLTA
jgi:hypothetical protein